MSTPRPAPQLLAAHGDMDVDGDFEDLETGEVHRASATAGEDGEDFAAGEETGASEEGMATGKRSAKETLLSAHDRRVQKKEKLKELFDAEYDGGKSFYQELQAVAAEQSSLNRAEFQGDDESARIQYEGFRPGLYVRMEIKGVPCELVKHFDPSYPLIVGGVQGGEQSLGYLYIKLKRHRWYGRTLKTRDPLIFSLGWRRFQSVPIYALVDHNMRTRMLKYTPEHMHCIAAIYGEWSLMGGYLRTYTHIYKFINIVIYIYIYICT